ncbi:MAG: phosphonopyruvate decarboxylase [Verrucomicrobia bacterium]|nr:MAG: phosphonopyruvate decarboxylase [Verrucomicrobiota bacterium]
MTDPARVFDQLERHGVGFFSGVPDSLLKDFCAYVTDHAPSENHVITANEGAAVGMAVGYHLATDGLALVYMQNSGLGNVVNPLLSLADVEVFSIPMILMVGWRGEPGVKDEPQHVKQGRVTLALLDAMEIPYVILPSEPEAAESEISRAVTMAREKSCPVALVVRKGTFSPYRRKQAADLDQPMSREQAIGCLVEEIEPGAVVVSTTGMISRELFEVRQQRGEEAGRDFLTVGSMGHASSIAFGVASRQPDRPVYCFDGDGAMLMHLGSLAVLGQAAPANFKHIVLNNGSHDSVGGQPTVGLAVRFGDIARACGYSHIGRAHEPKALRKAMAELRDARGPALLEIEVRKGSRDDLGRPTSTPLQNKEAFMRLLRNAV